MSAFFINKKQETLFKENLHPSQEGLCCCNVNNFIVLN